MNRFILVFSLASSLLSFISESSLASQPEKHLEEKQRQTLSPILSQPPIVSVVERGRPASQSLLDEGSKKLASLLVSTNTFDLETLDRIVGKALVKRLGTKLGAVTKLTLDIQLLEQRHDLQDA